MRAPVYALAEAACAQARRIALDRTREAYCPECGRACRLELSWVQFEVDPDVRGVTAYARWECCRTVGTPFRAEVRA